MMLEQRDLRNILHELISASTSLQMPDPETNDPSFTRHAFEHLQEAIKSLSLLLTQGTELKPEFKIENNSVDLDEVFIRIMNKFNVKKLEWRCDLSQRIGENELTELAQSLLGSKITQGLPERIATAYWNKLLSLRNQGLLDIIMED